MSLTLCLVQAVASAAVTYLLGWFFYCRYFHPLCSIPGPFLASISRIWIVHKTWMGEMEYTERALHKKYGYLVRIAPNEVSCSDPEAIKIIYGTKPIFAKSEFYDPFGSTTADYRGHFAARNDKEHAERRRIVNNTFSMASVLESEAAIDACTQLFVSAMCDFADEKSAVDLSLWLNMYAFDVLGELFFGEMFGFLRERTDVKNFMQTLTSVLFTLVIAGILPSYLSEAFKMSTYFTSSSFRGAIHGLKHLIDSSTNAVYKRKQDMEDEKDDKRDILRKIIKINADRGEKLNFTMAHVCDEALSSLFAGADTTAVALISVLYFLMRNPAFYKKATAEIDEAVSNGNLSSPITYAEAVKLPYLKACINEAMRLHPSIALTIPRVVPQGGATISGFRFPEGCRIGVNPAVVHYDQDIFGPDAEIYNPDRWIEGNSARMERALFTFGAGPRICIGKNISLSEIWKLTPQLMRDFHFRLADPSKEWKTTNHWFNKPGPIPIYVEKRRHGSI